MSTQDYGILVSKPDKDALTASGADILMNTKYPFAKLDTTKDISFRNITFTFNHDPPEPGTGQSTVVTRVLTLPHGYSYTPSFWALVQELTPPLGTHFYQKYFQDGGQVGAMTADDGAWFYVSADATNVYFNVSKFNDGYGSPNNLTGCVLKVRLYIFAEDVGY